MLLKVSNLSYGFKDKTLFDQVNFAIKNPGCYSIVGPSGGGKTTFLKCLAQVIDDYEGDVYLEGHALKALKPSLKVQKIGYLPQQYHLFPHMTILQNCIHPQCAVLGKGKEEAKEQALKMLTHLDVLSCKEMYPSQLSGGQQQRVAIARALCMGSTFLCLDEPSSALDPVSKDKLKQVLLKLKEMGDTLLISTHDIPFAESISDEVIELSSL